MADAAQSAVNSLLGSLSSVLLDEAQLLIGIRGDVQFIRDEMESMKGFLLDLADVDNPDNQVRAWMRQVQDLADDSENCTNRYLYTFGGRPPPTGFLGCLRRIPQLSRTMPDRHMIATQLRELKTRARDVGERRERYGVTAPRMADKPPAAARMEMGGDGADEQEDDAQRRRALADAADLLVTDASARAVIAWLRGEPVAGLLDTEVSVREAWLCWLPEAREAYRLEPAAYGDAPESFIKLSDGGFVRLIGGIGKHDALVPAVIKALRGDADIELVLAHSLKNLWEMLKKEVKQRVRRVIVSWLPAELAAELAADSPQDKKEDLLELTEAEKKQMEEWTIQEFGRQYLRVLAIVTVPPQDDDEPRAHNCATELAKRAYEQLNAADRYHCMAWVDAKLHPERKQRLQCILEQVHPAREDEDSLRATMSTWGELELEQEIQKHLKGKRFLIVLADTEGNRLTYNSSDSHHSAGSAINKSPWADIKPALPADYSVGSAIIVTQLIQDDSQFRWWYLARWLFLHRASHHKVHFTFDLDRAVRKQAAELVSSAELQGTVDEILKKCRWDHFSMRMVLHALYANPHVSKEELRNLLLSLNEFGTASNAKQTIRFCYDDLPNHYKRCLLYLSIFPQRSKLRRTSLVRRWAAENLIPRRHRRSALDEAERCFNALLARGLVLPSDIGHAGEVKSCTVDPHVFSFIAKIARDENVWDTDLPPDLAQHLSIRNGIHPQQLYKKKQQAARSNTCWRIHRRPTSTDLENSKDSFDDRATFLVNLLSSSSQLGLVKVLDLEGCKGLDKRNIKNICNKLFQLMYLSLRNTDAAELPNIDKLRYLETFDIRQTKVRSFHAKTSTLPKLVHLLAGHIGSHESFSTVRMPRGIGRMTNMQILSHVEVSQSAVDQRELEEVGRLELLRKLGVVIHDNEALFLKTLLRVIGNLNECLRSLSVRIEPVKDRGVFRSKKQHVDGVADDMNPADNAFSPPKSLASLNINGWIKGLPTWINELRLLSKITLCGTYLSDIQILGQLVKLRCMRLRRESYTQNNLTLKKKEFKRLEFLVIEGSDILHIHFEQDAAPKLEKIVWSLSTSTAVQVGLPGIEELPSLREVKLNGNCNVSGIAQAMEANRNHPILTYNPTPEATAAGSSSVSK